MGDANVGRNDPCPCGSGKKFKNCCIGQREIPSPFDQLADLFEDVRQAMRGKEFGSMDEGQAFVDSFMRQRNAAPADEFHGLSPEQMHRFLYFPFDSPHLVTFPSCLGIKPSAPILTLFELLVEAVGDHGLKPTATGNLPRKFVRDAALAFMGEEGYREYTRFGDIQSEPDFYDLHVTRIVAELSGLIRKYKGKFILSSGCRKVLAVDGPAGIYPRLLQAFAAKFNWGYWDIYPELTLIQNSFLFTLYLLHRYGDRWSPKTFYEDAFLRAFPIVLRHVGPVSYGTPESMVRNCYSCRCLERFAAFMGLTEIAGKSHRLLDEPFKLKKLPLLDEAVIFNV